MTVAPLDEIVRPRISFLRDDQKDRLYEYTLRILEDTGIRVDSPQALEIFRNSPDVIIDGKYVKIKREAVKKAIGSAPGSFDMYNQDGTYAFNFGDGTIRFGTGVTNLFWQDPQTDKEVPFNREHMNIAARLSETLKIKLGEKEIDAYDLISMPGVYQNIESIPEGSEDLYATLDLIANTNKPLVLLISKDESFKHALNLIEEVHGDLKEKPFFMTYVNPVTPLALNEGTCDKMIDSIRRGVPVIFSSYGLRGASTPQEEAGTAAVLIAESLAGLVFSQLVESGSKIVLSSLPSTFDMKTMVEYYEPKSFVINGVCAEMADYFDKPYMGPSGCGIGWGADLPASGGVWVNHLLSAMGKTDGAFFAGGNFFSKVFSPNLVVYTADVIQQVRRMMQGFTLNDEKVGLDEIKDKGPGGFYVRSDKIGLAIYRAAYYASLIFPRLSLEKWIDRGRPKADDILRQKTMDLINGLKAPEFYQERMDKGLAYIQSLGPLKA